MAGEVKVEVKDKGALIEEIDFAKISLEEAFKILECTPHGLTSAEAAQRLQEYGPNKLPESTRIPILVFLGYMWNPLAWAMEIAAIISIALLDYADFALIVALLLVNSSISYVEESNADAAIKALASALAPKALCFRDGTPAPLDAINLVPGDVIIIRLGNIVPADVKIMEEEGGGGGEEQPMQIDQAALTGESLPAKKFTGDVAFSGSAVKQGERHSVVYATGVHTFFGRAASLIAGTNNVANLQIVMTNIGFCCLGTIIVWVTIELSVQFGHYHHGCRAGVDNCPTLTNMLVIIVGGIPIAMPTVLSVTLALGAFKLAKEGAIVARMSAVEEMAGMDMLCSDKTGTLTLNKLSVEPSSTLCPSGMPIPEVLKWAALSANTVTEEPIDMVLAESYPGDRAALMKEYKLVKYIPFNPTDKYTCAIMEDISTGNRVRLLKGSPQVVLKKAWNVDQIAQLVNDKMVDFAQRGFRSLGLAKADGDGFDGGNTKWEMIGLISLFDPPRHDTKITIENCHHQGIEVKMITGDHLLIGKETARMLGMGVNIYPSEILIKAKAGHTEFLQGYKDVHEMVEKANGFAEVFPEHKFEIVAMLQENDHVCGMTGDGVNDAPALKKADVGIAVHGATDAARGAADIVLTEPGLSTIVTAVIGARKIFQRMTTYSKYTVAMTFRICFTFGLLTVIYNWYFPTILIVILAVFNDGAMIALSKDRVTPSKLPNSWNLPNIFTMGIVYGLYLTLSSWVLYQVATKGNWFPAHCGLFSLEDRYAAVENWCTGNLIGRPWPGTPYANVSSASLLQDPTTGQPTQVWQFPPYSVQVPTNHPSWNNITLLAQCITEQTYVRGGMMRTLLYNHVSISGQALVFVVRHQGWSILQQAGSLTYIAFFAAQAGSTLIAIFGFAGYNFPPQSFKQCEFCTYSGKSGHTSGRPILFFHKQVPVQGTESEFVASVIGCTGWVIVAWIWAAMWYVPLDLVKWGLCWALNEDGFRDSHSFAQSTRRSNLQRQSVDRGVGGMTGSTAANPLGRVSLSKPVGNVIPLAHGSVVAVNRTSMSGLGRVSANPAATQGIARRSMASKDAGGH